MGQRVPYGNVFPTLRVQKTKGQSPKAHYDPLLTYRDFEAIALEQTIHDFASGVFGATLNFRVQIRLEVLMFGQSLSIVTADLFTIDLPTICLRRKSEDVPAETPQETIRHVVEEMFLAMYKANGVGIAAPQLGVNWRLFVVSVDEKEKTAKSNSPVVLINPKITEMSEETIDGKEACLSIPRYMSMKVPRSKYIRIEGYDQHFDNVNIEATDFLARVFQHEYDHLDGILYIDRLRSRDDLETSQDNYITNAQATINKLYSNEVESIIKTSSL